MVGADVKAGAAFIEMYVNNSRLFRGINAARARLRTFGSTVNRVGFQLARLSAVMALPFVAGLRSFAAFERGLANVSTMLDEPQKHMGKFRNALKMMSVDMGEGTETLTDGLYKILSASIAPSKALSVLGVAAKAGVAGLSDTAVASNSITTLLNAFNLSANKAGSVADWLFSVIRRGQIDFAALAPNIGKVASIVDATSVSMEELGAMITLLTRSGVQPEEAMTAISGIINSFLKPSEEAKKFGMNAASLAREGFEGSFKKLEGLPPDVLAKLFPNVRALKGVIPALTKLHEFSDDLSAIRNRSGAMEAAFLKISGTFGFLAGQAKQVGGLILTNIGEALEKSATRTVLILKGAGLGIAKFISKNKELVATTAKVVLGVGAVGVALLTLGTTAKVVAFGLGGLTLIAKLFTGSIALAASVLSALLSPVALVGAALVGLGGYLLATSDTGAEALSSLGRGFKWLKGLASEAWGGIAAALAKGDIAASGRVLWASLNLIWQKGISELQTAWLGMKNYLLGKWIDLKEGLALAWQELWFSLKDYAINTGIAEPILKMFHAIEYAWQEVVQNLKFIWDTFALSFQLAYKNVLLLGSKLGAFIGKNPIMERFYGGAVKNLTREVRELEARLAGKTFKIAGGHVDDRTQLKEKQNERLRDLQRQRDIGFKGRKQEAEQKTLAIIDSAAKEKAALKRRGEENILKAAEALKKASEEYKEALKATTKEEKKKAAPGSPDSDKDKRRKGAIDGLNQAMWRYASSGTFNVSNLLALQSTSGTAAAEITAKNTAQTVTQLKMMNEKIGGMSPKYT